MQFKNLEHNPILVVRTESHCHGTSLPTSDIDTRGVAIPTQDYFYGLKNFEQYEDKENDVVIYGFKKFISLAAKGNLSALNFLFTHKRDVLYTDYWGDKLLGFKENFLSMQILNCIFGYIKSQIHRMDRGSGRCGNRQDLVDKHGYDTKFAYHAVMLGFIGIELVKTGTYHALRPDGEQKLIKAIRLGQTPYEEAMRMIQESLTVIKTLEPIAPLPKHVDGNKISEWCVEFLKEYFNQ